MTSDRCKHVQQHSPALALLLKQHPEWAKECCDDEKSWSDSDLHADWERWNTHTSSREEQLFTLRKFKYRHLLRLGARDLAGDKNTAQLLQEWSTVADILIDAAYSMAHERTVQRIGLPLDADGQEITGCIIALGKLGSRELNISSDIDIIATYGTDTGQSTYGHSVHEFFVATVQEMSTMLSTITSDGFVFRVDHELRPEGKGGALANSRDALLRYYEYFGSDWERYAWLRARPVAGNRVLGAEILDHLRPFIYRRSLTIGDLRSMRTMKFRMEEEASRLPLLDIKLGVGGIREAEFFVQAHQLLHGGRIPELRETNTFRAIQLCARHHILPKSSANRLERAYAFLRRTENMLQIVHETQTHTLPQHQEGMTQISRRMGYAEPNDHAAASHFERDLNAHRDVVSGFFHTLFTAGDERLCLDEAITANLSHCTDDEQRAESLAWFRRQQVDQVQSDELQGVCDIATALRRMTIIAESIISAAFHIARQHLQQRYGTPRQENGTISSFCILGFGKLGALELDYGSDLDLCFLYEGNGETDGSRPISNVEYFTKLAQRIITLITNIGRYGRAYVVDSDLRPDGRGGLLVASQAAFLSYHGQHAQDPWERLVLLKARAIAGDTPFVQHLQRIVERLAFERPLDNTRGVAHELDVLQQRFMHEYGKVSDGEPSLKFGIGGWSSLDMLLRFVQLSNMRDFPQLRRHNGFELLDALRTNDIIPATDAQRLREAFLFSRRLSARLRLLTGTSAEVLPAHQEQLEYLAESMGYSADKLLNQTDEIRSTIDELYRKYLRQETL